MNIQSPSHIAEKFLFHLPSSSSILKFVCNSTPRLRLRPLQPHNQWFPRPRAPCLLKRPVLVRRGVELDVEMVEDVGEGEADLCEGEALDIM